MLAKWVLILLVLFCFGSSAVASVSVEDVNNEVDSRDTSDIVNKVPRVYVIDTPNTNTLGRGSYLAGLSFSSNGDIVPEFNLGILEGLDLGIAWKLGKFLGGNSIELDWPALMVKYKVYNGNMTMPGVVVGCDTQGCFTKGDYFQKGRGLYIVAGRELFIDNLALSIGINVNEFQKVKGYLFTNATVPLYKEKVFLMVECDRVDSFSFSKARLNLGLRIAVTKHTDIDCIVRDCCGKCEGDNRRIPNERVLKICYSGRF